jgi:hypothetical protein
MSHPFSIEARPHLITLAHPYFLTLRDQQNARDLDGARCSSRKLGS